jgi:hypothetical protein
LRLRATLAFLLMGVLASSCLRSSPATGSNGGGGNGGGGGGISIPPQPPLGTCAAEPMRASGTTYFVCNCDPGAATGCIPGDDANDGTSRATPWRTFSKGALRFGEMAGGSTVAFCRGGSWANLSGTREIQNRSCSASSTCDMRDYDPRPVWGDGGEGKPVLQFGVSEWFVELGWYENYGIEPVRGFRFLNLDLVGSNDGSVRGIHVWGKVEDLEVCNMTFRDGFDAAYTGVVTSTIRRVNFHHNRILNNPFGIGPIQGTSCVADCVFDGNYMDLNGGASNRDHSIYVGSSPDPAGSFPDQRCASSGCYITAQRTRITNNELRRSARGTGTTCVGSALVVHEPHDGLVIENNLIYEAPGTASEGCFGIDVSDGLDAPGAFFGTVIRRNRVFNVGGVGIRVSECRDCIVEDNLIVAGRSTDTAIKYPDGPARPLPDSVESTRGIIRNNTVFVPSGPNSMSFGIYAGDYEGTGYVVTSNLLVGPGASLQAFSTCSGCETANFFSDSGASLFENPTTDPATSDFRPRAGTPPVDAGSPDHSSSTAIGSITWSPNDAGIPRPIGGRPDVGAFER